MNCKDNNQASKCSAGRSGYDIRADVLAMAKEYVLQEYVHQYEVWKVRCEILGYDDTVPEYPTVDAILDVASKMNDFVGKK